MKKKFTCHKDGTVTFFNVSVSPDGTVRVWDDVAGHYTTVHSMSPATQDRIRNLAARKQKEAAEADARGD